MEKKYQPFGGPHPGLIVFVLDQSSSMNGGCPDKPGITKAERLAQIVNETIREIHLRCISGDTVSPRCDIAVVGYHTEEHGSPIVESAWGGKLQGGWAVPIDQVHENPLDWEEVEQVVGSEVIREKQPIWIKATALYGTPMCSALRKAKEVVEQWINRDDPRPRQAPRVIHITDGENTEGVTANERLTKPLELAEAIRALETPDGNPLLVNCHIPSPETGDVTEQILYPVSEDELPTPYARMLFEMSSEFPVELFPLMIENEIDALPVSRWSKDAQDEVIAFIDQPASELEEWAKRSELPLTPVSRLMLMNATFENLVEIVKFMTIGSAVGLE